MENIRVYAQEHAISMLLLAAEAGMGFIMAFSFQMKSAGEDQEKESTVTGIMRTLLRAVRYFCGSFTAIVILSCITQRVLGDIEEARIIGGKAALVAAGILSYHSWRRLRRHKLWAFLTGAGVFLIGIFFWLSLDMRPYGVGNILYTAMITNYGLFYMAPYVIGEWWLREMEPEEDKSEQNRKI